MLFCSLKLAGLRDLDIKSNKGNHLIRSVKTVNITDLTNDDCAQCVADARYGGNDLIDMFQQVRNLFVQFFNLIFQKDKLFDKLLDLKRKEFLANPTPKELAAAERISLAFFSPNRP